MDFKELFEKTGFKVKENRFLNLPKHPYIVFFDDQTHRGADETKTMLIEHEVTVKLYVEFIENKDNLIKLENILDSIYVDYTRTIEWIESDKNFEVEYNFEFIEKKRRIANG